ncbi:cytochrome c biogenesis protein CcdA [Motilimonas sp. E26]|uniref:cytochrome c biogenesis protein CcdA n=1 Tax=Motilimonas sp. E26 TaxID=2865674 RepID=UPI001E571E50|nr:cytochrome c biogenesis protein CcdA [Motilimonas sp. E26]MCE0557746.1 sulfite exporter TauE/SafE family protein [Motilimonas sp. E26]
MESMIQTLLMQHELSLLLLGMVFFAGVLTSITPCVYPLLPITVSLVGNFATSRRTGFYFSIIYVLGLACSYAALGMLAASTGQLFGGVSSHPATLLFMALVCFLMAAWMQGWLRLPQWTVASHIKPSEKYKKLSIFLLGALSGLVMAPCTSPVLGMLLMFVAAKGNPSWGAGMMFVFAFGMSSLLILAGTFSGFLTLLPKSGFWLVRIKTLLSLLISLAGLYLVWQAYLAW